MKKRGQVGVEYMIIVGFVTFAITIVMATSFLYADKIKDGIKLNRAENFAAQVVNSAESVFFAGEPSKMTVRYYLPEGVREIKISEINNDTYLHLVVQTSSGQVDIVYRSSVPLSADISVGEGIKKLTLEASDDVLSISS